MKNIVQFMVLGIVSFLCANASLAQLTQTTLPEGCYPDSIKVFELHRPIALPLNHGQPIPGKDVLGTVTMLCVDGKLTITVEATESYDLNELQTYLPDKLVFDVYEISRARIIKEHRSYTGRAVNDQQIYNATYDEGGWDYNDVNSAGNYYVHPSIFITDQTGNNVARFLLVRIA